MDIFECQFPCATGAEILETGFGKMLYFMKYPERLSFEFLLDFDTFLQDRHCRETCMFSDLTKFDKMPF